MFITADIHVVPINELYSISVSVPGSRGYRTLSFSDPFLVGRGESCDVRLDDARIEARHVEVYRVGTLWWVRDLDSDDGTYLDEELIDVAPVNGSSTLRLGADGPLIRLWQKQP